MSPFPRLPWITANRRRDVSRPSASIRSAIKSSKAPPRAPAIPMPQRSGKRKPASHPAVFAIYVMPKAKEGFGSAFGRSLNPNSAAKLKFKTDFQAMKLFVETGSAANPSRAGVPVTVSVRNRVLKMEDSTYKGVYLYSPDA